MYSVFNLVICMQLLILLIACALMIGSFNIGNILFNFHLPNKTHNIWIYLLQVYDTQAAHAEEVYLVNALHFVARVRWRPQNKFHLLRYTMNINLVTIDWVYGFFCLIDVHIHWAVKRLFIYYYFLISFSWVKMCCYPVRKTQD